jgi:hypothetical protein
MDKMSFKDNLLKKLELEKLAARIIASTGSPYTNRRIDKEAMRKLLEMSPYQHMQERDLDLYVKNSGNEVKKILVLDNELPVFRSTVKDVVVRRSPRTLEMWRISTIRHILDDSDIKESKGAESVQTVLRDVLSRLDLDYTEADVHNLTSEAMAWLAGREAGKVEEMLELFAALLGYRKLPAYFGLDQAVGYGRASPGAHKETVFGPLVLYRSGDNILQWLDKRISPSDRQQVEFLQSVAAGRTSVPVTGDAVFEKLETMILAQPAQVRSRLSGNIKDQVSV